MVTCTPAKMGPKVGKPKKNKDLPGDVYHYMWVVTYLFLAYMLVCTIVGFFTIISWVVKLIS